MSSENLNPSDALEMKTFRKRYGLSQFELADQLKISRDTISAIERGIKPLSDAMRLRMKNFEMGDPEILKEITDLKNMVENMRLEIKEMSQLLKKLTQQSLKKSLVKSLVE